MPEPDCDNDAQGVLIVVERNSGDLVLGVGNTRGTATSDKCLMPIWRVLAAGGEWWIEFHDSLLLDCSVEPGGRGLDPATRDTAAPIEKQVSSSRNASSPASEVMVAPCNSSRETPAGFGD